MALKTKYQKNCLKIALLIWSIITILLLNSCFTGWEAIMGEKTTTNRVTGHFCGQCCMDLIPNHKTASFLKLNSGGYLLQNDGIGKILLNFSVSALTKFAEFFSTLTKPRFHSSMERPTFKSLLRKDNYAIK